MFDQENSPEGYSCECGGIILLYDGIWYCDKCDFKAPDNRKSNKPVEPTADSRRWECQDCGRVVEGDIHFCP